MAIRIQNSTIIDDSRNIVNAGVATVTSVSIGNTQVITSSRQLQNITSLDATTTSTIESAIANAPNTFTNLIITGVSTLGITSATNLTSQQLNVSGIATVNSNLIVNSNIGVGITNPTSIIEISKNWGSVNSTNLSFTATSYSDSSRFVMRRANGISTSPTSILSGDELGNFNFRGHDGTSFSTSGLANVAAEAEENYTSITRATRLRFGTTNVGSISVSNKMYLTGAGELLIGNPTITGTSSQLLQVTGGAYVSGSVGIGTTNPSSTLQVQGNALITGVTTSTSYNTGTIGSQTSGILTTTSTTANQVLDNLPTSTFQTARYQVSIACTGQLVTSGMTTAFTSIGAITAGAGYTEATYTNVALTGGSGNDAFANIGIGLSFNSVGFTSATDLIVTTVDHGLPSGVGTIAVSFASSIPDTNFTGFAVTAGNIYYAVGVGTTTIRLFNNAAGTSQVIGIGTTTFTGVGNTMTKSAGVSFVEIVSPGSGYVTGNTLSATLGTLGIGFSFTVSTVVRNYQSTDVMIIHSVGSAATACDYMEYATIANSEILGSFGADISGVNARLLVTPTYRNNTIKYVRTGITV